MKATIADFLTSVLPHFRWSPGALGFGIVVLFGLGTGHVLLAKGALPSLYPGYVPRTEFVQVTKSVDHIAGKLDAAERSRLRAQMRMEQRRLCQAQRQGNDTEFYEEAIDELQEEYISANGANSGAAYNLIRDCSAIAG